MVLQSVDRAEIEFRLSQLYSVAMLDVQFDEEIQSVWTEWVFRIVESWV